jgi:NADH dehydrogenase [ubiquinone] 1 alpha subcomplex assembly factor 7
LAVHLAERIRAEGPLRLDRWMAACNSYYYAARDPLGEAGDFVTAPEVSQLFGEMVGGWIGDLWLRRGSPKPFRLVELGPGRGTLMRDAARVLARVPGFGAACRLALVEASPLLRAAQAGLAGSWQTDWFDAFEAVPDDGPMIFIANEFFDALPVRQCLGPGQERAVGLGDAGFVPVAIACTEAGSAEWSPQGEALAAAIAARLARHGGAALIIDYGHAGGGSGDTLQALKRHAPADPFEAPGAHDLSAHVDFARLAAAAEGVRVHGPVPQGQFLARLGIEARAEQLRARHTPADAASIMAGLARLTMPGQMGVLFKAMAFSSPDWPVPAGFDA